MKLCNAVSGNLWNGVVGALIMHVKSGWPSGLRRYVQVVVYSVGVGSNPTPDNMFLSKYNIFEN